MNILTLAITGLSALAVLGMAYRAWTADPMPVSTNAMMKRLIERTKGDSVTKC